MRHAARVVCGFLVLARIPAAMAEPLASPDEAAVASATKALKVRDGETIVFFEDLHCATCAKKVTSRLFKVKGVMRVRTSVKLDAAVITPQAKKPVDPAVAWAALQKAGYQPTQLIGPDGIFVADDQTKEALKIAEAPTSTQK